MIPFLTPWLAGLLGDRFAKFAKALSWVLAIIAIAGLLGIGKCTYDRSVIRKHDDKITVETVKTDAKAQVEAAIQRGIDDAEISNNERMRHEAINKGPDSKPSAASIRLNCQRLQRRGTDTSRIAACAGYSD